MTVKFNNNTLPIKTLATGQKEPLVLNNTNSIMPQVIIPEYIEAEEDVIVEEDLWSLNSNDTVKKEDVNLSELYPARFRVSANNKQWATREKQIYRLGICFTPEEYGKLER